MPLQRTFDTLWPAHPLLSLALGGYAGSLVVAWLVWTTGQSGTAEAVLGQAYLVAVGVILASAFVDDLGPLLSRTHVHHLLVVGPAIGLGVPVGADYLAVGPDVTVPASAFVATGVAGMVALYVLKTADDHRVQSVRERDDPIVEWTARPSRRATRRKRYLHVFGGLVAAVGFFVGVFTDAAVTITIGVMVGMLVETRYRNRDGPREFALFRGGIAVEPAAPHNATFYPWYRLAGYSLTDDELVLHRRLWWSISCSRAEIDDLDAVTDALDRVLGDEVPSDRHGPGPTTGTG